MTNYKTKTLIFLMLLMFSNCKKAPENNIKIIHQQQTSKSIISDTLVAEIDDNYNLKLKIGNKVEIIDFFEPIKEQLINEKMYAQILYDKKNVIINLEIGQNADIYENIYLVKTKPIIINKKTLTTVIKDEQIKILVCESKENEKLTINSRYKKFKSNEEKCETYIKK